MAPITKPICNKFLVHDKIPYRKIFLNFDPNPKARLSARSGTDGNEVVGQGRNQGKSGSPAYRTGRL
ncbi:hypothetical protein DHC50_00580 [Arenibacter sp. A80]|jgi:hypothetical protein|nr:hypothetical protein [Arenibacter sp. A80]RFT57699.1 hypothetical protein D0S24_00580 [Arenibacter sp. P308M17]